jgi:YD repeat-containing protein
MSYYRNTVFSQDARPSFQKVFSLFFGKLKKPCFALIALVGIFSNLVHAEECQEPDPDGKYATNIEAYEATWCDARNKLAEVIAEGRLYHGVSMNRSIDYIKVENHSINGETYIKTCPFIDVKEDRTGSAPNSYKSFYRVYGCTSSLGKGTFTGNNSFRAECKYPFKGLNSECVAYCPEDKPELDMLTGLCVGSEEELEESEECELNPIIVQTGDKIESALDVAFNTSFPLTVKRIYRSNRSQEAKNIQAKRFSSSPSAVPGLNMVKHIQPANHQGSSVPLYRQPFGVKQVGHQSWSFLSLAKLSNYDTKVLVKFNDEQLTFIKGEDNKLTATHLRQEQLSVNPESLTERWVYKRKNNDVLFFDNTGNLTKHANSQGQAHYYSQPIKTLEGYQFTISDDFSNSLLMTKSFLGNVSSVEASNGIIITYGYDAATNNLIFVKKSIPSDESNPDALTEITKSYHYENTTLPYALTGITDEKGVRYATWVYDDFGRVIESNHINGVENGTVAYEDNATTVTNVLGKKTKYNYATVSGAKRLVSVDGIETPSCAAANKAYDYYPNGRVKTQTDWEGNVTYFEYNDKGQITKRTDAYGKPEALSVETTWHESLNEPVLITYPDKKESFKYNSQGLLINKSVIAL